MTALLLAWTAFAPAVARSAEPAPWIIPPAPLPVPMPPAPAPEAVVSLPADTLYVLDCSQPVFYTAMPAGVLTVEQVTGPVRIFARVYGGSGTVEMRSYSGPTVLLVRATGQGRAMLMVTRVGAQNPGDQFNVTIESGTAPVPPGPQPPGPQPPGPEPDPFEVATGLGLKCLVIVETSDLSKLPRSQVSVLTSGTVRGYLNAKCVKETNGWPAWRVWDQHVPTGAESPLWQKAMTVPRKSLPWVLIGNGKNGYSGPLPATVDETLTLLKRYGG